MKINWKHICIGILLLLVSVFIVPVIIDWAYKTPAFIPLFSMNWTAKDALSFYGSVLAGIIGAAAAIYVLQKTIQFTIYSQKNDRKLAVKPFLETRKHTLTDFDKVYSGENTFFLKISNSLIIVQTELPDDYSDKEFWDHNYILQIDLFNCGAGNAINVEFKMDNRSLMSPFCLTTDTPKRFICILNDDLIKKDICELQFNLCYADITSQAKYQQTEKLQFYRDINKKLSTAQYGNDLLTPPVEIKCNTKC